MNYRRIWELANNQKISSSNMATELEIIKQANILKMKRTKNNGN